MPNFKIAHCMWNRRNPWRHSIPMSRRAVTFMEVLVVVGVLLLLLSMLFPSIGSAREQSRRILCQNNLRQWGMAMQAYRDDNKNYLPMEGTTGATGHKLPYGWYNVLPPYLNAPAYRDVEGVGKDIREFPELHMWICPSKNLSAAYKSGSGKNQYHYGMNLVLDGVASQSDDEPRPLIASQFYNKPHTVLMFDIYPNSPRGAQADVGTSYHRGIGNVLLIDGSVRSFRDDEFVVGGNFKHPVPIWNHPHMYWGDTPKK
ncbi:DUF1559 domain-containing protein [Nitrospira sp. BLG_2]|uniref:DUF1559 family PulG-like putative transporter n=1 Tax=Nitrospira sp. BLG_2 TaxID=3397507 RepID=UPI003B9B9760